MKMIRIVCRISLALVLWAIGTVSAGRTDAAWGELHADGLVFRAPPPGKGETKIPQRRYAPDRKADILHIAIDVTPDFGNRSIAGKTTITFTPIAEPLTQLRLDAIGLAVTSLTSSAEVDRYSVESDAILVTFDPAVPPGDETNVTIIYDARPERGLYFRTATQDNGEELAYVLSRGQFHEAPHWYPNYDYPNEQSTSEMICRVPEEMTTLSNGKLISEEIDPKTGLKVVHWLQEKPHVNYLIALAAGKFSKVEGHYKDIPLGIYTLPSDIAKAKNAFKYIADAVALFESEIGIPYPWDKYYVVAVDGGRGMENTTLTFVEPFQIDLHEDPYESMRIRVFVHELAHQWFGDLVTCKDWSHFWLNEGFAVYYQCLHYGDKCGRDAMLDALYGNRRTILSLDRNGKPIVDRSYATPDELMGYRAYIKGAWVLHMLRTQLGEELFRQCVKTYLQRHAFGSVVTEDLRSVIEELTGRSFDQFFDQWVYHAGCPELTVGYSWNERNQCAEVSVRQTQTVKENATPFRLPTKIRFFFDADFVDREVVIDRTQHDFTFPLEKRPRIVRFDPELGLLAGITFKKPTEMLRAQLGNESDMIGRRLALEALRERKDKDTKTVAALTKVLNSDSSLGLRVMAAWGLRDIHTDEAFKALAESLDVDDDNLRRNVVCCIGEFQKPEGLDLIKKILKTEKSPIVLEDAVLNLGRYHEEDARRLLLHYLESEADGHSFVAHKALQGIRTQDDPFFIDPMRRILKTCEPEFSEEPLAYALETLGFLARNEEDKTSVRTFLAEYVKHENKRIRVGAISALGTLGDLKAMPIIERFSGDDPDDRVQRAAKGALQRLQGQKPVVQAEIADLREAIEELTKQNERLGKDLEELKRRLHRSEERGGSEQRP
jgi:aminopeptidase N